MAPALLHQAVVSSFEVSASLDQPVQTPVLVALLKEPLDQGRTLYLWMAVPRITAVRDANQSYVGEECAPDAWQPFPCACSHARMRA
jgi:hypothetical protein